MGIHETIVVRQDFNSAPNPVQKLRQGKTQTFKIFDREIELALKKLRKKDNYHGLLAWAETASIISVSIAIGVWALNNLESLYSIFLLIAVILVIGSRQRGLATLLHEASHNCAAENRRLNFILGTLLSGWWIFQVFSAYFSSHALKHHPQLGDEVKDPDTRQYIRQRLLEQKPEGFIFRNLMEMMTGVKTIVNFPYLLKDRLLPENIRSASKKHIFELFGFCLFWVILLSIVMLNGLLLEFCIFWIFPYFTTFQAFNWLIETSEHFPLTWLYDEAIYVTRNRDGNCIERFFTGIHGEGWHLVHHLRPGIPFWNLSKAHKIMLADPEYAASTKRYAGLFTNSKKRRPTILQAISLELKFLQSLQWKDLEFVTPSFKGDGQ